ncbi:hypothetical protein NC653_011152 [Populus alba x Populus x berolinensis]|uniref:Major facilitator superfamily (MFS) profile domain-containing protein n=2 Tax=Populus TaxID=3689 RepID=A0A4U5QB75_POPAL|nr:hypothetical protein NC653_011152 [Populus alba x Populus x berolinensis]TKS07513.1 hypothetical protein D5086_0000112780 [Populus alba]
MAVAIPFLQQLTGMNVVMFYAPVLLQSIGFERNASLLSTVITGAVNILATGVSIYGSDKSGRRSPFLSGGAVMFVFQVPSEIFPLEIRSAGQSITVAVNMLFTFFIAQLFLAMLCHFKFGLFIFFAIFVAIMSTFIFFFLPETMNITIEEVSKVWKQHRYWRRFTPEDDDRRASDVDMV